jgi:pyrimidine operon attenuation protein / uracil phosphoribosyltransferase
MTTATLKPISELLDILEQELKVFLKTLPKDEIYFIGIHSGGVWLAEYLHKKMALKVPLGRLDISFYRDDFEQKGLHPEVKPSDLPGSLDKKHIILIDDVVMTGRTIRAAMNEIFDYARPSSITLITLVELNARELPIRPDICGQTLSLSPTQRVELSGPQPLSLKIISKP